MYVCAAIPLWSSLHPFSALGNHSLTTHLHTGWWAPLRTRSHDHNQSHDSVYELTGLVDSKKVCVCVLIDWYSNHYKTIFVNFPMIASFFCQLPCNWSAFVSLYFWSRSASEFFFFFFIFTPVFVFVYHFFHCLNRGKREVFPQHSVCRLRFHPPPSVQTHLLACWCKHISQVVVCHTKDETQHCKLLEKFNANICHVMVSLVIHIFSIKSVVAFFTAVAQMLHFGI